jgi:hypothetical protein
MASVPKLERPFGSAFQSVPFRWVESAATAFGLIGQDRDAGIGITLRVPATMTLPVILTKRSELVVSERVVSLKVSGIDEVAVRRLVSDGAVPNAEIRSWFDKSLPPPEGSDLEILALALNIMRVTVRAQDKAGPAHKKVKDDIAALLHDLPKLIDLKRQDFQLAPKTPGAVLHGSTLLKAFDNLLEAAKTADKFLGRLPRTTRTAAWFSDALWIAAYLRMRGQTAKRPVGLTKAESPGVRFIESALARVCPDDSPTADAIARNMHRHVS